VTGPRRDRPQIPAAYGIATGDAGMLEWEVVSAALAATTIYWVTSVRNDGTPHLIPIWGGWADDHLYIEGGDDTLWARNLTRRPTTAVGADSAGMQIIVRGTVATNTPDNRTFAALADNYGSKYEYRPEPHDFFRISPATVLAWEMSSIDSFASTPTRFSFEEEQR
jgi:hypothetical protein